MHEPHTDRFDYDRQGHTYSTHRSTDPHIAGAVESALADAKTIVNVGAGTGSYEPEDLYVVAVEPSRTMRRQRLSAGRPPAVSAAAESLPFDDDAFDAAMAMITIHHWKDAEGGLRELRRVARDRVVIATFDPETLDRFWNVHYFPEMVERERRRYPTVQRIAAVLGEQTEVIEVAIPLDCRDGFQEAFYGRPEAFLDEAVRRDQSAWDLVPPEVTRRGLEHLRKDLDNREWDRQFGAHRTMPFFHGALVLVVSKRD